jgi:hypothetical protein
MLVWGQSSLAILACNLKSANHWSTRAELALAIHAKIQRKSSYQPELKLALLLCAAHCVLETADTAEAFESL